MALYIILPHLHQATPACLDITVTIVTSVELTFAQIGENIVLSEKFEKWKICCYIITARNVDSSQCKAVDTMEPGLRFSGQCQLQPHPSITGLYKNIWLQPQFVQNTSHHTSQPTSALVSISFSFDFTPPHHLTQLVMYKVSSDILDWISVCVSLPSVINIHNN